MPDTLTPPILRLTGEQIDALPGAEAQDFPFHIDFDEYEEFVRLSDHRAHLDALTAAVRAKGRTMTDRDPGDEIEAVALSDVLAILRGDRM